MAQRLLIPLLLEVPRNSTPRPLHEGIAQCA
jgi:hypothetical protein